MAVTDAIKDIIKNRDLPFFPKVLAIHMMLLIYEADEPIELSNRDIMSKFEVDNNLVTAAVSKLKKMKIIQHINHDKHGEVPMYFTIDS